MCVYSLYAAASFVTLPWIPSMARFLTYSWIVTEAIEACGVLDVASHSCTLRVTLRGRPLLLNFTTACFLLLWRNAFTVVHWSPKVLEMFFFFFLFHSDEWNSDLDFHMFSNLFKLNVMCCYLLFIFCLLHIVRQVSFKSVD